MSYEKTSQSDRIRQFDFSLKNFNRIEYIISTLENLLWLKQAKYVIGL